MHRRLLRTILFTLRTELRLFCSNLPGAALPEFQVITLTSCTVFAEDITQVQTDADLDRMEQWLAENLAPQSYNVYGKGVWFLHGKDAMLFKLTWG